MSLKILGSPPSLAAEMGTIDDYAIPAGRDASVPCGVIL